MAHEESGAVVVWARRLLLCRECGSEYDQKRGEDHDCPECGRNDWNFDSLKEYYD